MTTDTLTRPPLITAEHIRRVLDLGTTGLLVWLPAIDFTDVVDGLTPAQADSPDVVPLVTADRVRAFVTAANGVHASAATVITNVLADQHRAGLL